VNTSLFLSLQNKGELSDERKEENEKFQKSYEKLLANVSTLAVRLFTRELC